MSNCLNIMTRNPKCFDVYTPVDQVARGMKECNVGAIPIVDSMESNTLVGMITDRDLAVCIVAADKDPKSTLAGDIMTRNPVTCRAGDNVEMAMHQMQECQVRRIPVVDDKKRLVGIIAQADIACKVNDTAEVGKVVQDISK